MIDLLKKLYPICRSITGNGVRETLNIIKHMIPINIYEIQSGEKVYDWVIPKEWNINDAWIKNEKGEKIINFKHNNLHILNYSGPINKKINFEELDKHLFYIEDYPEAIPYLTTYYKENWGFCLSYEQYKQLNKNEIYEIYIHSNLENGYLTYADLIIKGKTEKEILFSCYICHPSMCNDSLSGVVVAVELIKYLLEIKDDLYYTYRFIFIPETIGSITYINKNFDVLKNNVIGGLVLTCCGDEGDFTYIKTLNESSYINKIIFKIFKDNNINLKIREFYTCGSDERQYNYPGIDLDIGSLIKTKYGEFKEYHTSKDDFNLVTEKGLNETLEMYKKVIYYLENNKIYNNNVLCEPKLGKYNLYPDIGGLRIKDDSKYFRIIMYYINSKNDIIDISDKLNLSFEKIIYYIDILKKNNLII